MKYKSIKNIIIKYRSRKLKVKGVATIEMAYIMPILLLIIYATISTTFYFHDKSVLNGIAYEAAVLSSQKIRTPKGLNPKEIEVYIQQNAGQKMIMLTCSNTEVTIAGDTITVNITASKQKMSVMVEQKATNEKPETFIRNIMKMKAKPEE